MLETETTEPVESTPEPAGRVEKAAMGTSLDAYRQAKTLEAKEPAVDQPAEPVSPVDNRKTRHQKEQERFAAEKQRAIDDATAPLRAELARLQRPEPARTPPAAAPVPATAPTQKDYQRYLAMPDAPKEGEFTDYKDYTAAVSIFVHDQRAEEKQAAQTRDAEAKTQQERDFANWDRVHKAVTTDPLLKDTWDVIKATNQVPANSPISFAVLSLKPFVMLEPGEQATIRNAIAEEIINADDPVGVMRELSKPGVMARVEACQDGRSLIRAFQQLERDAKGPAPVLETQAGRPATTLTSARATDPLDPVESALRRGDMTAYKKARTAERLRAAGLK